MTKKKIDISTPLPPRINTPLVICHGIATSPIFLPLFILLLLFLLQGKVVEQVGQKTVDPIGEGQHQVTVDPIFYPIKEVSFFLFHFQIFYALFDHI